MWYEEQPLLKDSVDMSAQKENGKKKGFNSKNNV